MWSEMELIAAVVGEAQIEDLNSLFLLVQKTKEHEFLFGPEIGEYIDEIYKKGIELHERSIVADEPNFAKRTELVTWFQSKRIRKTEIPQVHRFSQTLTRSPITTSAALRTLMAAIVDDQAEHEIGFFTKT